MGKKRILVVGSGGREHALAWKLAQSPRVEGVWCAPGNAGIAEDATCVDIKASDIDGLAAFAKENSIDITIIGPEDPLAHGIVDRFKEEGLTVFGPTSKAAAIEASKVFTKELLESASIPSGKFRVYDNAQEALDGAQEFGLPVAVKADGLAAGKGVILCHDLDQVKEAIELILVKKAFGSAGKRLIIEEFLTGEEASFMAVTDGVTVLPLASSQDHKAAFDGDTGPNTGGMGAYSPAPVVTPEIHRQVMEGIMKPTVKAMEEAGRPYSGVLYGGLMIKGGEAKVLEFNCRFGDPEAQPILMRMKTDLLDVVEACIEERLDGLEIQWDPRAAVCVVLASGGYPGGYETGKVIKGLEEAGAMDGVKVFHAGTALRNGSFVTAGGRVLGVTALGDTIEEAISRAYQAVEKISWEGMHFRTDIGKKALERETGGPKVGIVMGSNSDRPIMEEAQKMLERFGVSSRLLVASAHRSPALSQEFASTARQKGMKVIIAGAGMAAHLAGVIASHTTLPVIGVPIDSSPLNGLDSLLSTVQMPPGVPVATVSIGKAGARNAAVLAVQILALEDEGLAGRLEEFKREEAKKIELLNSGS